MIPQIKHLLICPFVFFEVWTVLTTVKKANTSQPTRPGWLERRGPPVDDPGFLTKTLMLRAFEVFELCTPGRAEIETAPGVRVDRPGTLAGSGFPSLCHPSQVWNCGQDAGIAAFFHNSVPWKKRCPLCLPEVTSGPIWLTGTSPQSELYGGPPCCERPGCRSSFCVLLSVAFT